LLAECSGFLWNPLAVGLVEVWALEIWFIDEFM
jgi:hypothetical protein